MEKVIIIDGKEVKLAATSGALYRYREEFKSDFLRDLTDLESKLKKIKKSENQDENRLEEFKQCQLEMFERIAYTMAKTADPSIPPIDRWLDNFNMFSIYEVLPEIMEIASSNFMSNQKKAIAPQGVQGN